MELRTITKEELATILEKHKMWLNNKEGGERANLENANLVNAYLWNANLEKANLVNANLWKANLWKANLVNANLENANLWKAYIVNANLWNANLENANLVNANLRNANLENANLVNANLRNACLVNANLGENHVRVYNFTEYSCYRANDYFRAGCQIHTIEEWKNFTEEQIRSMDGYKAWKFYNEVLLKIIDL